jgi:hypothetical protein
MVVDERASGGAAPAGRLRAAARFRYGVLLAAISASLVFQLAAPDEDWAQLTTALLQGGTLVLACWTSGVRPAVTRVAAGVALLSVAALTAAILTDRDTGSDATAIVTLMLVALAPAAVVVGVVRSISHERAVTVATMFGVLCIYLLLGMLFSFLYASAEVLGGADVFRQVSDPTRADYLYFSFTTLTTTGFGDLTADSGVSRAIATTEMLFGQIYLVTVVAAIVSNLAPRRR